MNAQTWYLVAHRHRFTWQKLIKRKVILFSLSFCQSMNLPPQGIDCAAIFSACANSWLPFSLFISLLFCFYFCFFFFMYFLFFSSVSVFVFIFVWKQKKIKGMNGWFFIALLNVVSPGNENCNGRRISATSRGKLWLKSSRRWLKVQWKRFNFNCQRSKNLLTTYSHVHLSTIYQQKESTEFFKFLLKVHLTKSLYHFLSFLSKFCIIYPS